MPKHKIKLIIVDFYGVMTLGSYKETCLWLSSKYDIDYDYLYKVVYHKYFCQAAAKKISEKKSFELPAEKLGLGETGEELRKKHLSFQKLNKPVFNLCRKLQKDGYKFLLLSKNTPQQFEHALKKTKIRKYFKNIINTFDIGYDKSSAQTINYVLKKFEVKPNEALMIDDQDFNLAEPKRVGAKTILYKNFKQFRKELSQILRK
jgi:FMN phosphatase YigB (HAD superfamily)